MGAWGGLCIFDQARFVREVEPALRVGERHPLIADEIARGKGRERFDLGDFRGLASVMEHFDGGLTGCSLGRVWEVRDGVVVGAGMGQWGYSELCDLFERVVTRCCISHVANMGRAYRASFSLSAEHGAVGVDPVTEELVRLLTFRGAYWTHGSGGYSEGIHGWLDADEHKLLCLGLPAVGPDPDDPEAYARLRRIADVAAVAERLGRGLLWGADLAILYPRWRE